MWKRIRTLDHVLASNLSIGFISLEKDSERLPLRLVPGH